MGDVWIQVVRRSERALEAARANIRGLKVLDWLAESGLVAAYLIGAVVGGVEVGYVIVVVGQVGTWYLCV